MALALIGGGSAAIAQPTTAVAHHTGYVTLVAWEQVPPGPQVITGHISCQGPWYVEAWEAFAGAETCDFGRYAYAFPQDAPAPWDGQIEWVNDSTYMDETGGSWHVAEVVYRTLAEDPTGGGTLVKAVASEIQPSQKDLGGLDVNYALPVDEDVLERESTTLEVGIGPAPPASATTVGPAA